MIYAKHDFTSNFLNAVGNNDKGMLQDMIIDEVAKLIVEDKKDIVKLLRKEGINVSINDTQQVIANAITKEIANGNVKFTDKLSKMVASRRVDSKIVIEIAEKSKKDKTLSAEGTFWNKVGDFLSNEKVQDAAATVISTALQNSFNKSSIQETQENQDALNERLAVNQMYGNQSSSSNKTLLIVGVVGGILLLGTILTIVIMKGKPSPAPTA
jgi:hypothetical protein